MNARLGRNRKYQKNIKKKMLDEKQKVPKKEVP